LPHHVVDRFERRWTSRFSQMPEGPFAARCMPLQRKRRLLPIDRPRPPPRADVVDVTISGLRSSIDAD
jgi:hypothetical protein